MNATFHVITGISEALIFSDALKNPDEERFFQKSDLPILLVNFFLGILLHAGLDYYPHTYPLPPFLDVAAAAIVFSVAFFFSKRRFKLLQLSAFLGNLFPDFVDHGIDFALKVLNIGSRWRNIFPWHLYLPKMTNHLHKSLLTWALIFVLAALLGFLMIRKKSRFQNPFA